MITIIAICSALLNLFLIGLRVVESIYQLRKNPDTDTAIELWAIVKRFFSVS